MEVAASVVGKAKSVTWTKCHTIC